MNGRTVTRTHAQVLAQIQQTIGCRLIGGSCVVHQRLMDKPRPGCPVASTIAGQGTPT